MTMESDVTARLLNFNEEPHAYVSYLDSVVEAFFGGNNGNHAVAVRAFSPSPHVLQQPGEGFTGFHTTPAIVSSKDATS